MNAPAYSQATHHFTDADGPEAMVYTYGPARLLHVSVAPPPRRDDRQAPAKLTAVAHEVANGFIREAGKSQPEHRVQLGSREAVALVVRHTEAGRGEKRAELMVAWKCKLCGTQGRMASGYWRQRCGLKSWREGIGCHKCRARTIAAKLEVGRDSYQKSQVTRITAPIDRRARSTSR